MRALIIGLLLGLGCAGAAAQQPDPAAPVSAPPPDVAPAPLTTVPVIDCEKLDLSRPLPPGLTLQDVQMCEQIKKLREEVNTLRTLGPWGSLAQIIAAGLGGILAGVAALLGYFFQRSFSQSQRERAATETKKLKIETEKLRLEADKLKQERLISLMAGLGAPNLPQQFGAASALFQRAEEALVDSGSTLTPLPVAGAAQSRDGDRHSALEHSLREEAAAEFKTLAKVLVTLIRAADLDQKVTKYIAEEVAGLFRLRGRKSADGLPDVCNLATHSLQNAKLIDVFWADVFAEGVDFFGADLTKTSFRRARLSGAIFYEATLDGVVFRDADLTGANFTGAKGLGSADFRGANLSGANFANVEGFASARIDQQTKWDGKTVWPEGFTPPARA